MKSKLVPFDIFSNTVFEVIKKGLEAYTIPTKKPRIKDMTLREQFEKEVSDKYFGQTIKILFEQRLENYVKWLENKINSSK